MLDERLMSRRDVFKAGGALAGALALGTVLGGCATGSSAGSTQSKSMRTVIIGYRGVVGEMPLFVGADMGFFEDAGFKVQLVKFDESSPIAMEDGKLDCRMVTPSDFLSFSASPAYSIIESLFYGGEKAVASEASEVASIKDLENRVVAVYPGAFVQTTLSALMRREGLNPDTVQWASTEYATMEEVLKAEVVSAVAADDPWPDIVQSRVPGSKRIFSWAEDEALKDTLFGYVGFSNAVLQQQPEIATMLSSGLKSAIAWIAGNQEQACNLAVDARYIRVNTDEGYTKDLLAQQLKEYRFASGDKAAIEKGFKDVWSLIGQAGTAPTVPSEQAELDSFVNDLLAKMVNVQSA